MKIQSSSRWEASEKEFCEAKGRRPSLWAQASQFAEQGAELYTKAS
jgi:hypothetical protein